MGAGTPVYAHLPLLHGPDGKKLSKRHGAASVQELRDRGYLPEAVRNYLALLGWGYDDETTFFTTEELQRNFSLEKVSKSPAVFDEQKLRWMNGRYLRELALDDLTARLEALTGRSGLRDAVAVTQEKISTLDEFWPLARAFFDEPADDPAAREKFLATEAGEQALTVARTARAPLGARAARRPVDDRGGRDSSARRRRALGDEGQAGLPAAPRRAHRHDDLAGHLRDRCIGRARPRAGADRRGPRRAPRLLIDHRIRGATAQPFVHVCR
jgi:glutamyl-tRNA synthetase